MTTAQLTAWMPGAAWAKTAGAHLRWKLRQTRADAADRAGRRFRYVHPLLGPFVYHPSDYLSRRLFLYNDFEVAELGFAIDRAAHGGTILDVGANIGAYTAACARAAGPRGRVIAIEPGPATFDKLTATCSALGLKNVLPLRIAAGRRNGLAAFVTRRPDRDIQQHLADARPHEPADRIQIEVRRLDDVCGDAGRVTLMKLDVEGHEVAALAGAERILSARTAHLIVEFNAGALVAAGSSCRELWDRLAVTHECLAIVRENGRPLPPVAASVVAGPPGDVCNTIWAPRA
jgi:FkbM family methyltransferase